MPTYRLGSSPLVHAPGLIEWAINAYAFPRDRAVILRVVTETWPGLPDEHAVLLLTRALSYKLDDDTVVLNIPDNDPTTAGQDRCSRDVPQGTGGGAMTEYVVKLRFWLRCWDSMTIDVDNDADAIAMAPQVAREMMLSASFPESIEAHERREGLVSWAATRSPRRSRSTAAAPFSPRGRP